MGFPRFAVPGCSGRADDHSHPEAMPSYSDVEIIADGWAHALSMLLA